MLDWLVDSFDGLGGLKLEFEVIAHQRSDRFGDDNRTRRRQPRDPGREVGAEPVYVVLRDVEIDQTPMDSDAHRDVEAEPLLHPLAERGHFPRDVETGLYCSSHVVLMGFGMTEHGEQP